MLCDITATANDIANVEAQPEYQAIPAYAPYNIGPAVPFTKIRIGGLGKLGENGHLWKWLPAGAAVDVTPEVDKDDFYIFTVHDPELPLVHTTECAAPGNPDNTRTTIGVGEKVDLKGVPANTRWSVSGDGKIAATSGGSFQAGDLIGGSVVFQANLTVGGSTGSATVTASVDGETVQTTFTILKPGSIVCDPPVTDDPSYVTTSYPGGTLMGASAFFAWHVEPLTVSFGNVTFGEEPDTTGINITWPSGDTKHWAAKRNTSLPANPCSNYSLDQITIGNDLAKLEFPINYMFNATSDVEWTSTWHDRYMDDSGTWVNFCPVSATYKFFHSNFTCQISFLGKSCTPQGPY